MLRVLRTTELGSEFIRLHLALALATRSSLRLGSLITRKTLNAANIILGIFLIQPRLHRRIGPGRSEDAAGERHRTLPILSHPPPGIW